MKNGKKPTLSQKKEMKLHGLQPENWLVIKDTREFLEVVSRMELKRLEQAGNGPEDYTGVSKMADVKTRELGKIVKKRLIELEMTQVQLANILGTSPQELCRMLKGKRPGYKYRKQMLKILKINENDVA